MDPVVPAMQNTDGEPLEFLTLHFAIDSQAAVEAAIANLKMIATAVRARYLGAQRRPGVQQTARP